MVRINTPPVALRGDTHELEEVTTYSHLITVHLLEEAHAYSSILAIDTSRRGTRAHALTHTHAHTHTVGVRVGQWGVGLGTFSFGLRLPAQRRR